VLLVVAILLAVFVLDPPWGAIVVVAAGIIELFEVLFWLFYSKRHRIRVGPETLIGRRAEVVTPCLPEGQVKLEGELWRARCAAGARSGEPVRVTGLDDLVLVVEPEV
jgi:membrane protein implicated in regulation of membrane protease activity